MRGVLGQKWWARAKTPEKRREPVPLVSGDGPIHRAALGAIYAFRKAYAKALTAWRGGDRAVCFPPCTWQMEWLHSVDLHPPPGYMVVLAGFRAPPTDLDAA